MCWICGEGFLHNGDLFKHCGQARGDYAEYRKRLFWRAQKDGFKPLLPWVKCHMLESATFHLKYSVPGSFSLKWSHPEAFLVAKERSEVACVVCARKDWLESRFTVYLWRAATGSSTYSELMHVDSGKSEMLTCGEHLCFGNRDLIDKLLTTKRYCAVFRSFHRSTSMHLLLCIQLTSACLGYSTPDVYPWCQTAARLRRAMLNSLLFNTRMQV